MAVDRLLMIAGSQGFPALRAQIDLTARSLTGAEKGASLMDKRANRMGAAGLAAAGGLFLLGRAGLKAAGDLQATQTGFESVLGSAEKAKNLYAQIAKFSLISPANNAAVARSAQLLLATGTAAKDVVPTLHAVGNAVAFSGAKDQTEKVVQVTRILAKLGARGTITARELNQIATRNLNPYKILRDELGLTGEQVANIGREGIKATEAVPALLRGFEKLGGGKSMERMNKTYVGQLSQMEDATDQFLASAGMLVLPDATKFVSDLTKGAQALKGITDQHPGMTKLGIKMAVGGTAALLLGSKLLKLYSTIQMTKAATATLAGAVGKDNLAEKAKTVTAGKETVARNAAAAATGTQAAKVGLLAKATGLLRGPVTLGGKSFQTSAAFGGGRGALGALGNLGAQGGAKSLGLVTGAGALASLGLGAVAGVSASNNMKAAGYTDGQSYMYGAATGIGAAGAAMFLPGGAVAVAVGEAAAFGINKLYNEPAERAALAGSVDPRAAAIFARSRAKSLADRNVPGTAAYGEEQSKRNAAFEAANNPNRFQIGQDSGLISNGPTSVRRDGTGTSTHIITVNHPQTAGNNLARQFRFNRATPRLA